MASSKVITTTSQTNPDLPRQPSLCPSLSTLLADLQNQQNNQEDYTKFTVQKLKQELTKHNFGAELLALRNPNKKEILALYEKCVLQKS